MMTPGLYPDLVDSESPITQEHLKTIKNMNIRLLKSITGFFNLKSKNVMALIIHDTLKIPPNKTISSACPPDY